MHRYLQAATQTNILIIHCAIEINIVIVLCAVQINNVIVQCTHRAYLNHRVCNNSKSEVNKLGTGAILLTYFMIMTNN